MYIPIALCMYIQCIHAHENEHITQNTYKLHACSHAYNTLTHTFVFAGA